MAENESLDLGRSRRWRRVYIAVQDDKSAAQIAQLVISCLKLTIKALRKPAYDGGPAQMPLSDLLNAVGNPYELEQIVRQSHGHDFARLFRDSTIGVISREVATERFLSAIDEKFFDQIEMRAVQTDGKFTFLRLRSKFNEVQNLIQPEVKHIAQQLVANPNSSLPRRRSSVISEIDTQSMLGESLLGLSNDRQ